MKISRFYSCSKNLPSRGFGRLILVIILAALSTYQLTLVNSYADLDKDHDPYRQQLIHPKGKRLRLAIPDFEMLAGDSRFSALKRALPELVAVGLIENRMVKYVDRGFFWRNAIKKMQTSELQKNTALIFKEEFLAGTQEGRMACDIA